MKNIVLENRSITAGANEQRLERAHARFREFLSHTGGRFVHMDLLTSMEIVRLIDKKLELGSRPQLPD